MTGNLNMGYNAIIGIRSSAVDNAALTVGGAKATYLSLLGNRSMQGILNMGGFAIKNIKPFVEDDSSQASSDAQKNDVINFGYFHTERGELKRLINEVGYDALNRKDPDPMEDDIDMANHSIINLKDPQTSDNSHAASVNFVNTSINHSSTIINGVIDKKIKESEEKSIQTVNQENVFKKVMDDDEFKEDDNDIHKIGVQNKNFHSRNKKTYEFKIDYDPDEGDGEYSARLSIDLIYLPTGSYTMVYEMYIDDGLTVIQIDASSGTLTVGKINSKINGTNTRSIIHFTKNYISSGFDDLDIDIKLNGKTDPKTTIYVVVYGIKGTVNDVDVKIWDRFYYYDGSNLDFEIPIDMNNNKIIGLADGTNDKHAVNKKQLDSLIKLYYSNLNITLRKNHVIFSGINGVFLDISKGFYLISYRLDVKLSSNYDSEGGIRVTFYDSKNTVYYHNHPKSFSSTAINTNIYMIQNDGTLTIFKYGSGIELDVNSTNKNYVIIYKLFDNLP